MNVMSGYRYAVGWGELDREKPVGYNGPTVKIGDDEFTPFNRLPFVGNTMKTPSEIFAERMDEVEGQKPLIKDLYGRFGAGVSVSITRNRNLNPVYDHGIRHYTAVSSGMYEVGFEINGKFSPEFSQWLAYIYGTNEVEIKSDTTFANINSVIPEKIFNYLKPDETGVTKTVYAFKNWAVPRMFDLAYVQVNSVTPAGGKNILGILVGCAIDSVTLTYESGNDATATFKISGVALNDFVQMADDPFDLNCYIADIPLNVLVAGCLSKGQEDDNKMEYTPIAQTERAEITISNNLYKLPQCLDNVYSGYAYGNLEFGISTKTYSNDPEKYLKHLYGVDTITDNQLFVAKKIPKPIPHLLIRSDNSSITESATHALEIFLEGTYVGQLDVAPSEGDPIMDEPELSPRKIFIAVTTTAGQNEEEYVPDAGDPTNNVALDADYFYSSLD